MTVSAHHPELTALVRRILNDAAMESRDVAAKTGLQHTNVSALRWGRRAVTEETAKRILAACGYRLVITAEPIDAEVSV